jgi:hypothetical protein
MVLIAVASIAPIGRAATEDTLILGDSVKTGTIDGYADDVCSFDGVGIPRASIYYIGLDAEMPPPQPQNPLRDEVHLRDGSIHAGRLLSIDDEVVATENARHPRKAVAWIWLTPLGQTGGTGEASTAANPSAEETPATRPSYEWAGTIRVENRYSGSIGHHRWQAEYRVRFLEVPTTSEVPGRSLGKSLPVSEVAPLEFSYRLDADQNWGGGPFTISYGANNQVISGDVTIRGQSSGRVDGPVLVESRVLLGQVLRLDQVPDNRQSSPADFSTVSEFYDYLGNFMQPAEPGWYNITVNFFGHDMIHNGLSLPPYKALSLYRGMRRGGAMPPFFDDPDEDLVHWLPEWMPDGMNIVGRLDDPDQSEVRGAYTLPANVPGGQGEPGQIAVEWSFARTQQ